MNQSPTVVVNLRLTHRERAWLGQVAENSNQDLSSTIRAALALLPQNQEWLPPPPPTLTLKQRRRAASVSAMR
jgi:hypothetical protein